MKDGMSVRATEAAVQNHIHTLDGDLLRIVDEEGNSRPVAKPRNEQIAALQQELATALGTKVDLTQTAKGKGRITIHFKNHDEFERLRQVLAGGRSTEMPQQQAG
jgi:ParB family transcriptional regulator, chromosome partitioning protein